MKRLTIVAVFFLLLLATACNTGGLEPASEGAADVATATNTALEGVVPTDTAEPTEAAARPTPTEEATMTSEPIASTGPVIILKRSGGFAGLEDQWTIYADGKVEGAPTTESPLSTDQIAQILADAEAGGFFELDNEYIDKNHCCDFFNYEVTINLPDGRSQTVTTVEQTPSMPPVLAEVIQELNFLLFRERIQE